MAELLVIDKILLRRIIAYCESKLPLEACGFLGGVREPDGKIRVMQWLPVCNAAEDPRRHFRMDGLETVRCLQSIHPPLEPVGILHSHPRTAALPSPEDLGTEWHTLPSHWIISLAVPGQPDVRAFAYKYKNGSISPISLRIQPEPL